VYHVTLTCSGPDSSWQPWRATCYAMDAWLVSHVIAHPWLHTSSRPTELSVSANVTSSRISTSSVNLRKLNSRLRDAPTPTTRSRRTRSLGNSGDIDPHISYK
jgi:hypothetical protein